MPDTATTNGARPVTEPSRAMTRYDGPRSTAELHDYSMLLAVNTTPDGRSWRNDALPATFRGNPAAVAFAVEYAKALDVSPITALIGIHIVDGKPTASAGLITALVRRAGHKIRTWFEGSIEEGTAKGITTITRTDDPDFEYRSTWTLDRAIRAGLMKRLDDGRVVASKPRSGWDNYPENMLKARSQTECSRDAAEDAILGVHYTPEELGVEVDEAGDPVYTVTHVQTPAAPSKPAPSKPETAPSKPAPSKPEPETVEDDVVDAEIVADESQQLYADALRDRIVAIGERSDLGPALDDLGELWRESADLRRRLGDEITVADPDGVETTIVELFGLVGKRLSGAKPPAEPEPEPEPEIEGVVVSGPVDVEGIADGLSGLSIADARRWLDTLLDQLPDDAAGDVIRWARSEGMDPTHSAGNVGAIVRAVAYGEPFSEPFLTRATSGDEGTEDPTALVVRVLGGKVVDGRETWQRDRDRKQDATKASTAAARAAVKKGK